MNEPLEDEVLQRAKAICADEGKIWHVGEAPAGADESALVDEASRVEYLNRARQLMLRERELGAL